MMDENRNTAYLTVCPSSFSMHDSFGNALTIEMGQEINEVEVLEQKWAGLANSLISTWVAHWSTI